MDRGGTGGVDDGVFEAAGAAGGAVRSSVTPSV
jgi:hypothetical protein